MIFEIYSVAPIGNDHSLIGGMINEGVLRKGAQLSATGLGKSAAVLGIQFYGHLVDELTAGMSAGIIVKSDWAGHLRPKGLLRAAD